MIKIILLTILIAIFISPAFYAQPKVSHRSKKEMKPVISRESKLSLSTGFYSDYMNAKLFLKANSPVSGDTVVYSDFDYPANSTARSMIDIYNSGNALIPIATAMVRKPGSLRAQELISGKSGTYATTVMFDTTANKYNFGYGTVIAAKGGPLKGQALLAAHGNSKTWFTKIDLSNLSASAPVQFGGNFPSLFYVNSGAGAGNIFAYSGGAQTLYKSTDQGATFTTLKSLTDLVTFNVAPSEIELSGSNDGKHISMYGGFALQGNAAPGLPKEQTDYVGWIHSEDGGTTWNSEKIAYDGYDNQITNRPGYFPYMENFGQVQGTVDDQGTTHLAINGYSIFSVVKGADTLAYYAIPVLYWNSQSKSWIAVSNQKADEDTTWDPSLAPRNAFGQCYPSISVSDDGKVVFIAWQSEEYSGEIGRSTFNVYPGDNGSFSSPKYYSDIMATYSLDGGNTFVQPFYIANQKNTAECYPNLARRLEINNGTITAHMLYYVDKIPGQSILDDLTNPPVLDNGPAVSPWIYKTYTFNAPTDVENKSAVINKFALEQNYPNPFNPATQISYSLEKNGTVTLKVYNLLGKEVATLLNNKAETEGLHQVNFDAGRLSSGMYIYTLSNGQSVLSKKMMVVK